MYQTNLHSSVRLIPPDDELLQARTKMESKRRAKKKRSREAESEAIAVGAGVDITTTTTTISSSHKSNNRALPSASSGSAVVAVKSLSLEPARSAVLAVGKRQDESKVYKDLFHADRDAKEFEKDLFINVGSFKYGLS